MKIIEEKTMRQTAPRNFKRNRIDTVGSVVGDSILRKEWKRHLETVRYSVYLYNGELIVKRQKMKDYNCDVRHAPSSKKSKSDFSAHKSSKTIS